LTSQKLISLTLRYQLFGSEPSDYRTDPFWIIIALVNTPFNSLAVSKCYSAISVLKNILSFPKFVNERLKKAKQQGRGHEPEIMFIMDFNNKPFRTVNL